MDTTIILAQQGILALLIVAGYAKLYREVKKGNKDQQEIKTRLHWIKVRQLKKNE